MKSEAGFSLIELLVVIVILGVLSAVAVPNLLASRRAANEASAFATLKTIHTANNAYYTVNDTFTDIPTLLGDDFLGKDSIGRPRTGFCPLPGNGGVSATLYFKNGYAFGNAPLSSILLANRIKATAYYTLASPESLYIASTFRTGIRIFYIDTFSNIPMVVGASYGIVNNGVVINPCSYVNILCIDFGPPVVPAYGRCEALN